MFFIGVDLSDKYFDFCITDSTGNVISKSNFDFDDDGFCSFVSTIQKHVVDDQSCIVGMENPHSRLVDFLIARGYTVVPTHPESIARYRESRFPSRAKTDPIDAGLIADFIREHHRNLRPINIPHETIRELGILLEDRNRLVEEKVRLSNQLTSTLKEYFPQALEAFGSLTNKSALEFLARFDTYEEVKSLSPQEIENALKECHFFRKDSRERFRKAMEKSCSYISSAVIKAKARLKNALVRSLLLLLDQIDDYERYIKKMMDETPNGDIFRSLPGSDYILGASLLVLYSSREFKSASEAQAFWGTCPYTVRSGKSMSVRFRVGCNKFGRKVFHQLAFCSLQNSQWAKKQNAKKRKEGKNSNHALRCIANTWVKVTFAMWRNKTPYDESKHMASVANHIMNQPAFISGLTL